MKVPLIVSGALYGTIVYLFMYFLIVPLSAAPFTLLNNSDAVAIDVFVNIICIGLPIALIILRYTK